ncbi:hypothetical protein [Xanthomonas bonasiae]|uniref:hypothetical protein n=1 Tax=Xanthomonas bonasiae TaxID=2810351 RepID=UPI001CD8E01B|nr:hypothetical protein [Xanthomonas surreyensis]
MRHLLLVQNTFQIPGRGLILAPDVPFASHFNNFRDTVLVEPPAANPFQIEADFSLTHFHPGGYKIFVTLPNLSKASVPIGSEISALESVHTRLLAADS